MDLLPHHKRLVTESAITPPVAAARGYRSVRAKAELERLGFAPRQCRVPALLHPIWDVRGERALYQIRPDEPRIVKGRSLKYETPKGARLTIDVHPAARPGLADPSRDLIITEGIRKADAAVSRGLCAIDLLGVWAWRGTNELGGKVALSDWESIALQGRKVYLAFDSDVMEKESVYRALERLKAFLERRGARVFVIYLPGDGDKKIGLDDFFAQGGAVEEFFSLAEDHLRVLPKKDRPRQPEVFAQEGDLAVLTAMTWEAIGEANVPPTLFRCGGHPARIEADDCGRLHIRTLDAAGLKNWLTERIRWFKLAEEEGSEGQVAVRPPGDLITNLLASPDLRLPVLSRLLLAPAFASDGELVMSPGYHAGARAYYPETSLAVPPVSEAPCKEEIERAKKLLLEELLGDFPFLTAADKAAALALVLQPFARDLVDGPTPLFLIEKPTPGTGAGLLIEVVCQLATGTSAPILTEASNEEEWRKRITSVLMDLPSVVLLDNLKRPLDSPAVAAALTAETWTDRVLGHSQIIRLPVRCTWAATGNNPSTSSEIARRSVPIRLDARVDRPWERTPDSFLHPDLRRWTREHRGDLLWAVLTIIKAWLAAGRPASTCPHLGSYESWSEVLGGILAVAEIPGFLENLPDFYARADLEGEGWRILVGRWWESFGSQEVGVGELFPLLQDAGELGVDLGRGNEHSQKVRLGQQLRGARDRYYGELQISVAGQRGRAYRYRLLRQGSESCESDESSPVGPKEVEASLPLEGPASPGPLRGREHSQDSSHSSDPSEEEIG